MAGRSTTISPNILYAALSFNDAMTGFSKIESPAVVVVGDVSQARTVVDAGGGQGALMAVLLRAHQHLEEVVIFDRSGPMADTPRNLVVTHIAGRAGFISGRFVARVPKGGNLDFLKSILRDWKIIAPLRSSFGSARRPCRDRASGRRGARDPILPSESKLSGINMLVTSGGS
jgi:hypothetical protein